MIILYWGNNMDQNEIESSHNEIKKQNLHQFALAKEKSTTQADQLHVNSNGFSQRPTLYQILPALYACLMLIQIGMLAWSFESKGLKIGLGLTYAIITLVLGLVWFRTTSIDPTDNTQILHKEAIKNEVPFNNQLFKYFCHICQTCVSKDSFHCRKCNRCVQLFDHHCKWLNNCIGAKNYLQFLALIVTVQITLLFHIVVNAIHIAYALAHQISMIWVNYTGFVFLGFDCVFIILNSILVVMHLYLVIKKKTTLQLILERRKENKIFPTSPEPKSQQAEEKISCSSNYSRRKVREKVARRRISKQKRCETISQNMPYSFKTRSKSFKIKFNHFEK